MVKSATVKMYLTSDERKALEGANKMQRKLEQMEQKFKTVGRSGQRTGRNIESGMSKATKQATAFVGAVTGIGGAVGGVMAIAQQLKREYDHLVQRQRQAGATQAGVGRARAGAALQIPTDMDPAATRERISQLSQQYNVPQRAITEALGPLASARGSLNDEAFWSVIEQGTRLRSRIGPGFDLAAFGSYGMDVARGAGIGGAGAGPRALGFLTEFGGASRITSIGKQGRALGRMLAGGTAQGFAPEAIAELGAYATQAGTDPQGEMSATAVTQWMQWLGSQKVVPTAGGGWRGLQAQKLPGMIGELQKWYTGASEAQRRQFAEAIPGESTMKGAFQKLVSGQGAGAYARAHQQIGAAGDPAMGASWEARLASQEAFTGAGAGGVVALSQMGARAREGFRMADRGGFAGALRQQLKDLIGAHPGFGELEGRLAKMKWEAGTRAGTGQLRDATMGLLSEMEGEAAPYTVYRRGAEGVEPQYFGDEAKAQRAWLAEQVRRQPKWARRMVGEAGGPSALEYQQAGQMAGWWTLPGSGVGLIEGRPELERGGASAELLEEVKGLREDMRELFKRRLERPTPATRSVE